MNLIQNKIILPENSITYFRREQYNQIPDLFKNGIHYLNQFGLECDDDFPIITKANNISYQPINGIKFDNYAVYTREFKENRKFEPFFKVSVPSLVSENFFFIKGTKYIPVIYVIDEPILLKSKMKTPKKIAKTIVLFSLYKPLVIRFDFQYSLVMFGGKKFNISTFLRLFFNQTNVVKMCEYLDVDYVNETDVNVLASFSKLCKLTTTPKRDFIIDLMNKLFFDEYTKGLYKEYYGFTDDQLTLSHLIKVGIKRVLENDFKDFNDLNFKRLSFNEALFKPIFMSTSSAVNYLLDNHRLPKLSIGKYYDSSFVKKGVKAIIAHFNNTLGNKNQYGCYNSYTALQTLKTTFDISDSKESTSRLPAQVSSIHPSYKNVFCPITISNQDIGKANTIVPTATLKSMKYGIFDK